MNAVLNLFCIFIFILTLFLFRFPNISDGNYAFHKVIIFILILFHQIILNTINKILQKCKINIKDVIHKSMQVALFSVIGYSICVDIKYMCITKPLLAYVPRDRNVRYLYVAILLIVVMALLHSVYMMFGFDNNECEKYDQQIFILNKEDQLKVDQLKQII